ncbi:hypothetical protein CCR75_009539 [Bremia lactucae]|uniref:Secreted protein n=1 Tax=Bremia lactucae TaxID=4779 RepID=A0A976FMS3_BRELC|nr:hypothetical protein CCR75_009539 [Bremia lactucae]
MPRLLVIFLVAHLHISAFYGVDRMPQVEADKPVTLGLADGTTRELSTAEFEALSKERAQEHAVLQIQKEDSVSLHCQDMDVIQAKDPKFALIINLAKKAFREIQRHGYAQGYSLAGFDEREHMQGPSGGLTKLELRTRKDSRSGALPKTGTGTRRLEKEGDETPLYYEVHLVLDAQERLSVIAAWELSEKDPPRGQNRQQIMRLSIQPTAAMLERDLSYNTENSSVATWLLAGGLAMIAAGVLIMYNTRRPVPERKPRRRSSDIWELVDKNDMPITTRKPQEVLESDPLGKKND